MSTTPAAFARERLRVLIEEVRRRFPTAIVGPIEDDLVVPVSSAVITFANGIRVDLFNDLDVPALLFEILRSRLPDGWAPLPFERWLHGDPRADKLTSEAALELLQQYAQATPTL